MKRLNALYMQGYRDAIRTMIECSEIILSGQRKKKVVTRLTPEWLKLVYDRADEYADGGRPELWIAPDGRLFFKDRKNC